MKDKKSDTRMLSTVEFRKRDYEVCSLSAGEQAKIFLSGVLACLLLDYLFYEQPAALIPMIPLPFLYLIMQKRKAVRKRKQELNYQFRDVLTSLSVAVRAGYSLENAVHACTRDLEHMYSPGTDILEEFHYMESQIRVSVPAEELFYDFGKRSGVEDIINFASVINVCRRMGGDMSSVIQKCAGMVADKIDVHREISTSIAAKKVEQNIMRIMPAGIILYLKLTSPGFLTPMYGNAFGAVMMTVCLMVYGAAYALGRKIVDIDV